MNFLVEIITGEWFHLTIDVAMCVASIYLVYKLYTLMTILINRKRYEKFGSIAWFTRVRAFGTTAMGCVGAVGLSIVTFVHLYEQTHQEELSEVLSDVFIILILMHAIFMVQQLIYDRLTKGSK